MILIIKNHDFFIITLIHKKYLNNKNYCGNVKELIKKKVLKKNVQYLFGRSNHLNNTKTERYHFYNVN